MCCVRMHVYAPKNPIAKNVFNIPTETGTYLHYIYSSKCIN